MSTTAAEHGMEPYPVQYIAIQKIVIGKQSIRADENDDDIIELASSISAKGLLQPIGVSSLDKNRYQLRWGLRRLTAFKRLGRQSIPALVYPKDSEPVEGIALIENIMRRDLTLEEECNAVNRLHNEENLSPSQICDLLGKSRNWVNSRLSIRSLTPNLQAAVLEGRISLGAGEKISSLPSADLQNYILQQAIASNLSIYQVGAFVDAVKATPSVDEAIAAGEQAAASANRLDEMTMRCQVCGSERHIRELVVIRVCKDGCRQAEPINQEGTPHA